VVEEELIDNQETETPIGYEAPRSANLKTQKTPTKQFGDADGPQL
jgi:hypothetical protein